MLRRRLRLPAAAGASLLIAASATVLAPTEAAAAPAADDAVQVTIDSFTPSTPKPGDAVTITGKVTNKSSVTFGNPQAIACIDGKRLAAGDQIAAIPTEDGPAAEENSSCARRKIHSESTAFEELGSPLAPQATVPFKLVVQWSEWGITAQPGVYVVGVAFRGNPSDKDGTVRDTGGQARTLMPVISKAALPGKVNTALVLPLQHRPTLLAGNLFANDSLALSMAPTGPLGRLLELGKKQTVSWLVDPAMIDEARTIADSDTYRVGASVAQSKPGGGRKIVKAWLDAFEQTRGNHPVVLLPYGDPDVGSLVAAGGPLPQVVLDSRSRSAGYPLLPVQNKDNPSGLWLGDGEVTTKTLIGGSYGFAGRRPDDVNILPSSAWTPAERPKLQPSPVYNVETPEGPPKSVKAVIANSALLAGGPDPTSASQPLQVRQRFAAETSLLAGVGAATVVAVPPRGWDEDTRSISAVLEAMSNTWIAPVGITQVASMTGKAAKAPAPRPQSAGLSQGQLDKIRSLSSATTTYRSLLAEQPNPRSSNLAANSIAIMAQALLRSASSAWKAFPDESQRFLAYQQTAVADQLGKVRIISNSSKDRRGIKVNLSGSKGSFPLTVENGLDVTIQIGLQVTATGNRNDLRIESLRTLDLPAGQKGTFQVKASAEQNGLINATAQLVTLDKQPVGDSQPLVIQAAQYGSVGWILVGAAVALLFGTSIVRIYRRVRSERRNPAKPEGDALHPAPLTAEDLASSPDDPAIPEPPTASNADVSDLESLKEGVGTKDG